MFTLEMPSGGGSMVTCKQMNCSGILPNMIAELILTFTPTTASLVSYSCMVMSCTTLCIVTSPIVIYRMCL